MKAILALFLGIAASGPVCASEGARALAELCKLECPTAKDEAEAIKCMDGLAAKKKSDKKFRKTDCFAAYKEHSSHGKEDGHKH